MKAWSYSALKSFESCPRKYYEMNVIKNFVDKPSEAMAWGDEVHKAFDRYFSKGEKFPIGMRQFEKIAKIFERAAGEKLIEQKLALADTFSPVTWFAKNAWVRSIVDLAVIHDNKAVIVDWKTGKRREDLDQLALMAAVMFNQAEELEEISAMFVWLSEWDEENPLACLTTVTYTREELPTLWERFVNREKEYQKAHAETKFPPKPSGLCRNWCAVSTCPYHGG